MKGVVEFLSLAELGNECNLCLPFLLAEKERERGRGRAKATKKMEQQTKNTYIAKEKKRNRDTSDRHVGHKNSDSKIGTDFETSNRFQLALIHMYIA